MTQIEQMIQDMCPNGVEWKTLGEVCEILDAKRKPVTKSQRASGEYPYYGANGIQDYVNDYIFDGTFLLIGEDGSVINKDKSPVINWAKGKIWVNNHAHILSEKKDIVLLRFLYYYLQTIDVSDLVWGTPPKLNQQNLRSIEIPLPPLEIQNRIVEILDRFSALAAELQAELQMRRKQYEYYRTRLLTPHSESDSTDNTDDATSSSWQWKTLGEIGTFTRGRRFVRTDIVDEGQPCIHYGDMYTYYGLATDHARTHLPKDFPVKLRYAEKGDVIIVGAGENDMDIGVGCVWEGDEPVAVHDACYIFKHKQNPKYISHYLRTLEYHLQIKKSVSTAKICAISPEGIGKAKIPLPPLAEQARIVAILDKFEALTTSLSDGIPAEQIAQQRRYEYYRDKLLSFPGKPE